MADMKSSVLTIRLDPKLSRQLAQVAKRTGKTRSEVVRDALQRQLALTRFRDLRRRIMPLAQAQGYLTDEDVFGHPRRER
jgi:predicted transcriptional regulator